MRLLDSGMSHDHADREERWSGECIARPRCLSRTTAQCAIRRKPGRRLCLPRSGTLVAQEAGFVANRALPMRDDCESSLAGGLLPAIAVHRTETRWSRNRTTVQPTTDGDITRQRSYARVNGAYAETLCRSVHWRAVYPRQQHGLCVRYRLSNRFRRIDTNPRRRGECVE